MSGWSRGDHFLSSGQFFWDRICVFRPSAVSDDQEQIVGMGMGKCETGNFCPTFPETFYQCNASRTEQSIIVRVQ